MKHDGDKFINDFVEYFSLSSVKNDTYAKIMLHVVLGQALCKNVYYHVGARKVDIRTHMLLIKPQATGKGAGFGVAETLCKHLRLQFDSLTTTTDAGLVGTIVYDPQLKQHVKTYGLLKTSDIIGMEEASVIFDSAAEYSKDTMTLMQITMNPLWDSSCYISKKLGADKIEFKPHASFILTSYPPDNLAEKVLKTGFIDRLIPIFEDVTLEQRLEIIKHIAKLMNMDRKNIERMEKNILGRFGKIVNNYKDGKYAMIIPTDVRDDILRALEEFAIQVLDASPKTRQKLEHFVTRLYDMLLKLSVHHALLDLRTTIDKTDVLYARRLYLPIWKNMITHIESLLIIDPVAKARRNKIIKSSLDVYDALREEGVYVKRKKVKGKTEVYVRRLSMLPLLQQRWDNCSKETADRSLGEIEKSTAESPDVFSRLAAIDEKDKYFERVVFGSTTYLKKIRDIK